MDICYIYHKMARLLWCTKSAFQLFDSHFVQRYIPSQDMLHFCNWQDSEHDQIHWSQGKGNLSYCADTVVTRTQ